MKTRTIHWITAAVVLALSWQPSVLFAEELPRIVPAGLPGALILAGSQAHDDALDRFVLLNAVDQARIVILRLDDDVTSISLTQRLLERFEPNDRFAELSVIRHTKEDPREGLDKRLHGVRGIWVLAGNAESVQRLESIAAPLRHCLASGGVVAAAGAAANKLTTSPTDTDPVATTGLGLFPDAIVTADALSDDDDESTPLDAALAKAPASIGYRIHPTAVLAVQGRRLYALGEGGVDIQLQPGNRRDATTHHLDSPRAPADLTALRRAARARQRDPFPADKPPTPNVENGTLIIIGGGGMPSGIIERFVELAGGKEASIVVLPTAMPDPVSPRSRLAETFKSAGAKEVTVLPGRTIDKVDSEEYLDVLGRATGIWFGGGRQWRFADAYLDTKALDLMHECLKRGGVIMGSSAGASIQADYLARANPLGNLDIMAEGYEIGLGFVQGVAVDQHFSQRRRFKDMSSLVKRYPQVLGIGIDEATALVVEKHIGSIVGRGGVHFYDAEKPVTDGEPDYESVYPGGKYDLAARKILEPGTKPEPRAARSNATPMTLAQRAERYATVYFERHDADRNGSLDAEEQKKLGRPITDADSNKDGSVSKAEFTDWIKQRGNPDQGNNPKDQDKQGAGNGQ